jgi:hypothetical protein
MPQTPKSISASLAGTAVTAYTVPAGGTAILKTALAQNVVGGTSSITVQKVSGGVYYPLIITQNPVTTPATGGTAWNSRNLIDGPITLGAGESIVAFDNSSPQWKFPKTNNTFLSVNASPSSLSTKSMTYGNGIYVMVCKDDANSKSMVLRSTDANTWTEIATGNLLLNRDAYFVKNAGSTWIVAAYLSGDIMYSTDNALTWTLVTVSSSANAFCLETNGTLFALATSNGVYTSSNAITWNLNATLNSMINVSYSSSSNVSYAPQSISWNGSTWFVSTYYGVFTTTDWITFGSLYNPMGGAFIGTDFSGITWSSLYSKFYCIGDRTGNGDVIVSSTNGFAWTHTAPGTNVFGSTINGTVNVAGSNNILIAKSSGGSTSFLKSTDGISWTSATDSRGYQGMIRGLANGYFISCQNGNQSYYMTTDPATSTGTLFSTGGTSNTVFRDAASNGTGWVMTWYNASSGDTWIDYGSTPTSKTGNVNFTSATAGYGNIYRVVWWAAAGVYAMISDNAYLWTSPDGSSWSLHAVTIPGTIGGSPSMVIHNGVLYVTGQSSNNYLASLSVAQFTAGAAFTTIALNTSIYTSMNNGYGGSNNAYPETYHVGALASDGTNVLVSNNLGGTAVYTPSVGAYYRTPGAGAIEVQRVNGLDFVTLGRGRVQPNGTYGYFYGSNIMTTLPTAQVSTGAFMLNNFPSNPNGTPNSFGSIVYYGGAYYIAGQDTNLSYGSDPRLITRYSWSSTNIGGIVSVYAADPVQNKISTDGTNFLTYSTSSGTASVAVYKGTTPLSNIASSTISFGLVELT